MPYPCISPPPSSHIRQGGARGKKCKRETAIVGEAKGFAGEIDREVWRGRRAVRGCSSSALFLLSPPLPLSLLFSLPLIPALYQEAHLPPFYPYPYPPPTWLS
eukprot:Sspe_Gene.115032::Locus_101714_Transcript_1_1_Confidence_1.000_Length_511::g.115032::m.115032